MTTIYIPWNTHFGDQWATITLLAHKARREAKAQFLSQWQHDQNLGRMQCEIISALGLGGQVQISREKGNTPLSGYDVWAAPSLPTWRQWDKHAPHATIAYQFDGHSSPSISNPSSEDEQILLRWLEQSGFLPVRLGKHLTVDECCRQASEAVAFIGVDSGMSHLCHSVNVPIFLLQFKLPVVTTHRGKPHILADGCEDFMRHKWPTWVDYLRFIGHPDGVRATVPQPRPERDAAGDKGVRWWLPS